MVSEKSKVPAVAGGFAIESAVAVHVEVSEVLSGIAGLINVLCLCIGTIQVGVVKAVDSTDETVDL